MNKQNDSKSFWSFHLLFIVVCLIGVLLTSGCGSTQVRIVEKNTYVPVEVDQVYLADCEKAEPPAKAEFKLMGDDQRIDALIRTLMQQYKYTAACSTDKKSIRDLIAKQKAIIDERNAAEEARVKEAKEGKQ